MNVCPYCGNPVEGEPIAASPPSQQVPSSIEASVSVNSIAGHYQCPRCGNTDYKERAYKLWITLILLICGIAPALIYYLLRHDKVKCPQCGKIF